MLKVTEQPWNILVAGNKFEVDYVKSKFSFDNPRADIIRRRNPRLAEWDGLVKFYRKLNTGQDFASITVGRGMGERLKKIIEDEGIDYEWTEREKLPPIPYDDTLLKDIEFDDIQKECLAKILENQVCSIELVTGSGKGEIIFMAVACFLKKFPDARILIVTSKKVLIRDLERRFKKRLPQYLEKFGLLGDGNAELKQIAVATPNSSSDNTKLIHYGAIAKWKEGVDLLILDECHRARSNRYSEIIHTCKPDYLWAVSGKVTYQTDEIKTAELEAIFGPPVYVGKSPTRTVPVIVHYHYHSKWNGKFNSDNLYPALIDGTPLFYRFSEQDTWKDGVWRGPDADGVCPEFMLKVDESGKIKVDKSLYGIYRKSGSNGIVDREEPQPDSLNVVYWSPYDQGVMEFSEFNVFYAQLASIFTQKKEKWVISVRRSRQIFKFQKLFLKRFPEIRVGIVDGSISGKKQLETFDKLERGELDGVVSQYTISAEGVDVPSLSHFIKLDGLSSEQLLEQQKGRVQRVGAGKHYGTIHVPSMGQHYALYRTFLKIKKYYTDIKKLKTLKTNHK